MNGIKIIFAGAGEFGLPTLRALHERRAHEIVRVVTQPDRRAGRGRALTPTAVARFAAEHGLPLLRTGDVNKEVLPSADLLVVIALGQKIAEYVVHHARLGSINLHASRLPKYRGAAPINWSIIRGETVTGNSVIRLASKMDAGAVLAQSELPIGELETAGELHERLAQDGVGLTSRVIDVLAEGRAIETPQDESLATLAPKFKRESSIIDWSRRSRDIANQIRGMYPWPGCHVRLTNSIGVQVGRVTLVRASPKDIRLEASPGTIGADDTVFAGDGSVVIHEVQPEGKRAMSLAAYKNGHPWKPGIRLESIT